MIQIFTKKDVSGAPEDTKKKTKVAQTVVAEKTPKKQATQEVAQNAPTSSTISHQEDIAGILKHPRMTEKATLGIENKVYVFDVSPRANKKQIKEAVKRVYKVDPVKVHVVTIAKKGVRNARTGIRGVKSGGKKAYVYLKKSDTITLM